MLPTFTASEEGSQEYFRDLNDYMRENVLNDKEEFIWKFICKHRKECRDSKDNCKEDRRFYPGQLSHVGKFYDLEKNGKPFRIMISGAETGGKNKLVNMEERSCDVVGTPTTPHMKGTLYTLQLLFGEEPDDKDLDITIDVGTVNILEAFSLANFILCSSRKDDSSTSAHTGTMQKNCAKHFEETIKRLKPQIIILQGGSSHGFFNNLPPSLHTEDQISLNMVNPEPFRLQFKGKSICDEPILVLPLYHPSSVQKHYGDRITDDAGKKIGKRTRKNLEEYVGLAIDKLLCEYEDMMKKHGSE